MRQNGFPENDRIDGLGEPFSDSGGGHHAKDVGTPVFDVLGSW